MRRIRVALLLLFLALLAPIGVLTWRALDGLAYERAARHQAVSERVFEEMERGLSGFLAREEARPAAHYHFYLADGGRSPLASAPAEPFVVGGFEIDTDGAIHTPLEPDDVAAVEAGYPEPELASRDDAAKRVMAKTAAATPKSVAPQPPGTTQSLSPALPEAPAPQAGAEPVRDESTAYDVLQRFNRVGLERAERKQKVEEESLPRLSRLASRGASLKDFGAIDSVAPEPMKPEPPRELPPEAQKMLDARAPKERADAPAHAPASQGRALQAPAPPAPAHKVRVAVDPMQGRVAGEDHLLLVRSVQLGREAVRQGLVLDRAALARWLEQRAIEESGLASVAEVAFRASDALPPPPASDGRFAFRHRFAEPFDPLTADLRLAPLPGVGSPGTIYALVALLGAVGAAGLFALHRMVSVTVGYAERRSNFVAAVTHELKTPLTAIRMYAKMLRDGLAPTEAKRAEYTRTITDESERLSRLIDNVLEFARLERGRRDLSLSAGPVAPVLEEAVAKLASHAAREGFALELAVEPGLPPVRFDRHALLQVLFNLVDNAMKYARTAGARRVVLEARRANPGVVVAVRDFGPGVAPAHLAHIFEPFYRGVNELTRGTQGTGIGLALVRELAQRMGAQVVGMNLPDGGFRVSFAFAAAE
ncbi:MAG TPA: HAMP domain-containing sensor histidine kinase [Myxococcota bacterium]|nr:HAMP domain-containing sensor histidine kinase [Myxococcota bacterium]